MDDAKCVRHIPVIMTTKATSCVHSEVYAVRVLACCGCEFSFSSLPSTATRLHNVCCLCFDKWMRHVILRAARCTTILSYSTTDKHSDKRTSSKCAISGCSCSLRIEKEICMRSVRTLGTYAMDPPPIRFKTLT